MKIRLRSSLASILLILIGCALYFTLPLTKAHADTPYLAIYLNRTTNYTYIYNASSVYAGVAQSGIPSLSIQYGDTAAISWLTSGVIPGSCTVYSWAGHTTSGRDGNGTSAFAGDNQPNWLSLGVMNETISYTLSCDALDGAKWQTTIVAEVSAPPPTSCSWNGGTITNGTTVTAYQAATVPFGSSCSSQTRTCNSGTLSGSYQYASCSVSAPASCTFNGQTIASGSSVTAYQSSNVPTGQTCTSQTRTCTNGTLSGTYAYSSCTVGAQQACTFNGQSVASGSSITAYQYAFVPYGTTCAQQSRSCTNGTLSGTYPNATCSVNPGPDLSIAASPTTIPPFGTFHLAWTSSGMSRCGIYVSDSTRTDVNSVDGLSGSFDTSLLETTIYKLQCLNSSGNWLERSSTVTVAGPQSCTFNGQSVLSGSSVTAYQTSSVPFGSSCASQTRTCTNGTLSGSYAFATCTVSAPASCTFNGQTIASGSSVTAYQSSNVPTGQTCTSQTRTCTNGTLSGTYAYSSCTVGNQSCTFNGVTIASGSSTTAYLASSVPSGQTCTSQPRTCTNGTLSGTYQYSMCSVAAPTGPLVLSAPDATGAPVLSGPVVNAGVDNSPFPSVTIPYGASTTLTWSTSGMKSGSCTLYKWAGAFTSARDGNGSSTAGGESGTYATGALTQSTVYTLSCTNASTNAIQQSSLQVFVSGVPDPYSFTALDLSGIPIPASLPVNAGVDNSPFPSVTTKTGTTLQWSTIGMQSGSCTLYRAIGQTTSARDANGSGVASGTSGTYATGAVTQPTAYTFSCIHAASGIRIQSSIVVQPVDTSMVMTVTNPLTGVAATSSVPYPYHVSLMPYEFVSALVPASTPTVVTWNTTGQQSCTLYQWLDNWTSARDGGGTGVAAGTSGAFTTSVTGLRTAMTLACTSTSGLERQTTLVLEALPALPAIPANSPMLACGISEGRMNQIHTLLDYGVTTYTPELNYASRYPGIIYDVQELTANSLLAAENCKDIYMMDKLAQLYLVPFSHMSTDPQGNQVWGDSSGYEVMLYETQFIYAVAKLVNVIGNTNQSLWTANMTQFMNTPRIVAQAHVDRWVNAPSFAKCNGSDRTYTLKQFSDAKYNRSLGTPSYCNASGEAEHWSAAAAVELLTTPNYVTFTPSQRTLIQAAVQSSVKLFEDRVSLVKACGGACVAAIWDVGGWRGHPNFPDQLWANGGEVLDISHSRRFVEWIDTYYRHPEITSPRYSESQIKTYFANAVSSLVWNGSTSDPLLTNYMNGVNVPFWHEGYLFGNGFSRTDTYLRDGYGFWAPYNSDIGRLNAAVVDILEKQKATSRLTPNGAPFGAYGVFDYLGMYSSLTQRSSGIAARSPFANLANAYSAFMSFLERVPFLNWLAQKLHLK